MNENLKYAIAGGLVCGLSSAIWFRIGVKHGMKLLANEFEKQLSEEMNTWHKAYHNWKRYDVKM